MLTVGAGGKQTVVDPKVWAGGTRHDVLFVYAWDGGSRRLVWFRQQLQVASEATAWDDVRLTITPPGPGADAYVIQRNGVQIGTSGDHGTTVWTFDDSDTLMPSTSYTYRVTASLAGVVLGDVSVSVTTPARSAMSLTAGTTTWDTVPLTWTDPDQQSVDGFKVYRGQTEVYSGTTKAFTDTGLLPSTAYTYTLRAYRAGVEVPASTVLAVTTPAYGDLGLAAGAAAYNQINLSWSPKVGSIDEFILYRDGTEIYRGLGTSKADTGLGESSGHSYTLWARRAGTNIQSDTASASTPPRPTSSAIAYGPAMGSGYGWTQSTGKNLTGPTITLGGAGTNYVSFWNMRINGYSGSTGMFTPVLGGVGWPTQYPGGSGAGDVQWANIDGGNRAVGTGGLGTSCSTGGNANYRTQWQPYTGGSYSSNVNVGQVNYWWYAALLADRELLDAGLKDREVHVVTLNDWEGNVVAKRVFDRLTGALLFERGDLSALEARIGGPGRPGGLDE